MSPLQAETANILRDSEDWLEDVHRSICETHDCVALSRELIDDSRAVLRRADDIIATRFRLGDAP